MKNKFTLIIAAFAILISFAFITKSNESVNVKANTSTIDVKHTASIDDGYALEDEGQWD